MKIVTALLLASTLVATGQAAAQGTGAATLQDFNGKVLMNKGDGLVSGKAGAALKDGDRIVTLEKSGAKIVFADGCTVTLEENNIFVINAELGCKALPVASTGAAGGVSGTTAALIGAGVLGLGLALGGGGGGGSSTNDNRPISAQ